MGERRRERGEGTVQRLPSGKVQAVLPLGFRVQPDGGRKRVRVSATFDTRREALAWLRERALERDRGQGVFWGGGTLGDWLRQWLEARKGGVADKTWDKNNYCVEKYIAPRLGALTLARISPADVQGFLAGLARDGYSASERHKAGQALRQALGQAVRLGLVAGNVATRVPLPRVVRPEKQSLTREQARALVEKASLPNRAGRLGALCLLGLDTGCRPGELFALHWEDLDWDTREVFVHRNLQELHGRHKLKETKTPRSRRRVLVSPTTMEALRRHREAMRREGHDVSRGLVFCDTRGGFLRRGNFQAKHWNVWLRAAGVPRVRPYDLRHTCATLLLQAGVNVKVVSQRLGHEDIATTLRHYAHALPGMQEQAASAMEDLLGG